jgi:hypothetical protein
MSWLKPTAVRKDVEDLVGELTRKTDSREKSAAGSYDHALVAAIVSRSLSDGHALKREWFFAGFGAEFIDGDQETCYFSRAPISNNFATDNVFHWTHWIGRAYVQLKEAIQNGEFPKQLIYGPPGRVEAHPTGPLVHYQFIEGQLKTFEYRSLDQIYQETVELPAPVPMELPLLEEAPHFGLKDIVELRDVTQDDQIRGSMAGIYTLIGGPGTGKTTVALHRIPYLLLEQKELLPLEFPDLKGTFFHASTMHVVVWKDHLVPYLKDCLVKLYFGDVTVNHIDDWVASRLRSYVRIGRGKEDYQVRDEPEEFTQMKLGYVNEARNRAGAYGKKPLRFSHSQESRRTLLS